MCIDYTMPSSEQLAAAEPCPEHYRTITLSSNCPLLKQPKELAKLLHSLPPDSRLEFTATTEFKKDGHYVDSIRFRVYSSAWHVGMPRELKIAAHYTLV